MLPADAVTRFAFCLAALHPPGERLGIAVSGGPDSLALLALAAAARPGLVLAATVDHGLRDESASEAGAVAAMCGKLGVAHRILTVEWAEVPTSALQERARNERYRVLGQWAESHGLGAIATGHHADDQAETLLMRLVRGAGVRGLAGMRPVAPLPGAPRVKLLRPLLDWRRDELGAIVDAAGLAASDDPSNHDERHERVRVRRAIAGTGWIDPATVAASAAHLAAADEAIEFAVDAQWAKALVSDGAIQFEPAALPAELRRRMVARAIAALGCEGDQETLRGGEIDRLISALEAGGSATLRGVLASGGAAWRFTPAPARR